jgi:hypothetical protein
MSGTSPFDHRPDPELGDALQSALSAYDEAGFVRRVVAAADADLGAGTGPFWQVLGAWARPALVAALLVVAVAGFWLGATMQRAPVQPGNGVALGDPLAAADSERLDVPVLLAGGESPPSLDAVMAVALDD